ncbi:MAG: hypothetical protein J7L47_11160 [Candidatus Odinarchaeota archaeon]|nr:hypothetical protein [Candidatus Odinarchaeota archaeon]
MSKEGIPMEKTMNIIVYGLEKALWNIMGEQALAITSPVGIGMLELMKKDLGLKVSGESAQDVLDNIAKRFVSDFKIATDLKIKKNDNLVTLEIKGCVLRPKEVLLEKQDIKPFICPFANVARAAMEELLGLKTGIKKFHTSDEGCSIEFEIF